MYSSEQDRNQKYNQAKEDLFKCLKSVRELSGDDQRALLQEIIGYENFMRFLSQIQNIPRW